MNVAVGATFSTSMVVEYTVPPPSLSRMTPRTVSVVSPSSGVQMALLTPSRKGPKVPLPQSKAYRNPLAVSTGDGSCPNASLTPNEMPSGTTLAVSDNCEVGATFVTATDAEIIRTPKSLSRT